MVTYVFFKELYVSIEKFLQSYNFFVTVVTSCDIFNQDINDIFALII